MASIDDFFAGESDVPPYPRLKHWKAQIDNGGVATLELDRPPTSFGLSPASMIVQFRTDGKQLPPEECDWDEHLNNGLIQLKVRAVNSPQESERFALGLRDGLRPVEAEFGNGFFNSVLLDLVVESKLDQYEQIAAILKAIYQGPSRYNGPSYDQCRDAIALGISARAKELRGPLAYSQDEAKEILAHAIANYLDERFSIGSRRQFGLH